MPRPARSTAAAILAPVHQPVRRKKTPRRCDAIRIAAAQSFTPEEVDTLDAILLVLGAREQIAVLADTLIIYSLEEARLLDAVLERAAKDGDVRSAVWEKTELLASLREKVHRVRIVDEQLRALRVAAADPAVLARLRKKADSMLATIERRRRTRSAEPPAR